jgi:hypothetical protein
MPHPHRPKSPCGGAPYPKRWTNLSMCLFALGFRGIEAWEFHTQKNQSFNLPFPGRAELSNTLRSEARFLSGRSFEAGNNKSRTRGME